MNGRLLVVSGPSGTGKSVITQRLAKLDGYDLSISMTTRAPRTGEQDGISYFFVSQEEYNKTVEENGFLEHASIYGNCYGTPKTPVLAKLAEGHNVILEIEMQGAMQAKQAYPEAVLIFVLPPSMAELKKRLTGRGTESEEQLGIRLAKALSEIRLLTDYDYYVVNENIDDAVAEIRAIAESGKAAPSKEQEERIIRKYEEEM